MLLHQRYGITDRQGWAPVCCSKFPFSMSDSPRNLGTRLRGRPGRFRGEYARRTSREATWAADVVDRVIDVMPVDMLYPLPPGYVLLDARKGRPLRAWAAHLEFRG
jgi:hypothetical protein